MADLEIQKGEFKVVGVAHTAAERWLSCKRLFIGRSGDMLPQEKVSILKQFWSILRHILVLQSQTHHISMNRLPPRESEWCTKVSRCDVLKVQISSCTLGK